VAYCADIHELKGGAGTGCGDLGDTLMNDACSGFVNYVKSSNEYYYDKSNADLQAFVQQTPSPSAQ
jgi:hypothetical protein